MVARGGRIRLIGIRLFVVLAGGLAGLAVTAGAQDLPGDPAMTALALRVFLTTPHENMPNLILTDAETDNVIAWILGLKTL